MGQIDYRGQTYELSKGPPKTRWDQVEDFISLLEHLYLDAEAEDTWVKAPPWLDVETRFFGTTHIKRKGHAPLQVAARSVPSKSLNITERDDLWVRMKLEEDDA